MQPSEFAHAPIFLCAFFFCSAEYSFFLSLFLSFFRVCTFYAGFFPSRQVTRVNNEKTKLQNANKNVNCAQIEMCMCTLKIQHQIERGKKTFLSAHFSFFYFSGSDVCMYVL